jgi:hypothetical protein
MCCLVKKCQSFERKYFHDHSTKSAIAVCLHWHGDLKCWTVVVILLSFIDPIWFSQPLDIEIISGLHYVCLIVLQNTADDHKCDVVCD